MAAPWCFVQRLTCSFRWPQPRAPRQRSSALSTCRLRRPWASLPDAVDGRRPAAPRPKSRRSVARSSARVEQCLDAPFAPPCHPRRAKALFARIPHRQQQAPPLRRLLPLHREALVRGGCGRAWLRAPPSPAPPSLPRRRTPASRRSRRPLVPLRNKHAPPLLRTRGPTPPVPALTPCMGRAKAQSAQPSLCSRGPWPK